MPIAIPLVAQVSSNGYDQKERRTIFDDRTSTDPLPVDVVVRIASHLASDGHLETVSSLVRSSKELYFALCPVLYQSLDIKRTRSDTLLTLPRTIPDLDSALDQARSDGSIFSSRQSTIRRLASFRYVRHMNIYSLPSDTISEAFALSVSALPVSSFPSLDSVTLLPDAVDDLRTWVPPSYDRPRNPPFLEALTCASSPSKLCIRNRTLLAEQWEEHRDLTVLGQYQVVARINRLKEDGWGDLNTLVVHNIVHQVLPSLPNCRNIYHFSSHITGSASRPVIHRSGQDATYLPGPQWSYRAWQLGTAIKNLFPSGVDAEKVLDGTAWEFVNTQGHVLTKMFRDDDDESGVGYDEVLDLVKGAVKDGLPQDLPMREGFGRNLIGKVFEKITYAEDGECGACGRNTHSAPLISSLKDIS